MIWGLVLNVNVVWHITATPQMLYDESINIWANEWMSSQRKDIAAFIHGKSFHADQHTNLNDTDLFVICDDPNWPKVKGCGMVIVTYMKKDAVSLISKVQVTGRLFSLIFLVFLSPVIIFQLSLVLPIIHSLTWSIRIDRTLCPFSELWNLCLRFPLAWRSIWTNQNQLEINKLSHLCLGPIQVFYKLTNLHDIPTKSKFISWTNIGSTHN